MQLQRREFLGLLAAGGAAAGGAASSTRAASATQLKEGQKREEPARAATRRADPWLEISAANLEWNLRQIQARVGGKRVMAVIKANGYGHGLVRVARVLEKAGARDFLVAKLDEARELRAAGIRGRILNFGVFADGDAPEIVRLGITQNVYTDQVDVLARAASRAQRPARVEIKVDTGLGRFGVPHEQALDFIERVAALRGVQVEGVFTTLTEDPDFDPVQLMRLKEICRRAAERGVKIGLRHAASSAAIVDFPEAYEQLDMVRPGITLYGLYPSERAEKERKLDLRPVMALKARLAYVKTLRAGESVSYHRAFTATQPERLATLPVGYSDGFPRALAGKGNVLIAGRRCPIVAMSANATMVRLADTPAAIGDEAVLIGTQGDAAIPASEVARQIGGSVYGVAMGMSALLPAFVV